MTNSSTFTNDTNEDNRCTYHLPWIEIIRTVISTLGWIGNLILLAVILRNRKYHTRTYFMIGSLALADFVYTFNFSMRQFLVVGNLKKENILKKEMCFRLPESIEFYFDEMNGKLLTCSYGVSCLMVAFIAVCRYIILTNPLKEKLIVTKRMLLIVVAIMWTILLAIEFIPDEQGHVGTAKWTLHYPIPLLVIAVLHIVKIMKVRNATMVSRSAEIKRMTILVVIIILTFAVFPLPWNVVRFLRFYTTSVKVTYEMWTYTGCILLLNNCLNPYLYGFVSPEFRRHLFSCCLKRRRNVNGGSVVNYISSTSSIRITTS